MRRLWKMIASRIQEWFYWHFRRYKLKSVTDTPEGATIRKRTVYWVGEDGYKWCLVFRCPCDCGEIIYLNLLTNTKPVWRVIKHEKGEFSVSPSINRIRGCRAHFFLREGMVVWAKM